MRASENFLFVIHRFGMKAFIDMLIIFHPCEPSVIENSILAAVEYFASSERLLHKQNPLKTATANGIMNIRPINLWF
jgi:hypothetical protein